MIETSTLLKLVIMLISILCLVAIILICFNEYLKRTKFLKISRRLPTAFGIPLLGAAYKWIPPRRFFSSFNYYFEKFKSYTYFCWLGSKPFIVTADPDTIKIVLSSEEFLNKSSVVYSSIDRGLSNGIITSQVEKWKHNRKLINTAHCHSVLTSFVSIFNLRANKLIPQLNAKVGKGEQDVFKFIKRTTLRIAFQTTMGVVMEDGVAADEHLSSSFNYIIEKVAQDAMLSVVHLGFIARSPKYHETIHFMRNFVVNLLKNKLINKDQNNNQKGDESEDIKKSKDIFIQRAFKFYEKGQFSLDDVITESQTMIAGSFETVSTTIFSVLVLLAMHPDIQERLFEEIKCILPSKDMDVDLEHLKNVPYLDMIIAETLRLMPSIPFIGREVVSDFQLNDIFLPRKTQILIPIFNLHRRKDLWGPEADQFNPDNFLPDNVAKRHPYSYIPFSKGARNCVGWRYAQIALPILIMKLVRNFIFKTSFKYQDLVFVEHVSIRYEKEPHLIIISRK